MRGVTLVAKKLGRKYFGIEKDKNLFENLDNNKIPYLNNEEFLDIAKKLSKNPDYLKNNKFWGLHNKNLN